MLIRRIRKVWTMIVWVTVIMTISTFLESFTNDVDHWLTDATWSIASTVSGTFCFVWSVLIGYMCSLLIWGEDDE